MFELFEKGFRHVPSVFGGDPNNPAPMDAPFENGIYLKALYVDPLYRKDAVAHLQRRIILFVVFSALIAPFDLVYRVWDVLCESLEVRFCNF